VADDGIGNHGKSVIVMEVGNAFPEGGQSQLGRGVIRSWPRWRGGGKKGNAGERGSQKR
jgi:hypothetical protein